MKIPSSQNLYNLALIPSKGDKENKQRESPINELTDTSSFY